jgi:hypothetical protein
VTRSDARRDADTEGDRASVRFSFDWYESFLREIEAAGYSFGRFDDPLDEETVLLRHDVDLSPQCALQMAEIEADLGVQCTYFVMVSSPMYNVLHEDTRETLTALRDLGHDVGLHFSTHQYWAPEEIPADETVTDRVLADRAILSTAVDPVETVSFHIPPDAVLERQFPGFPSTYEPRLLADIDYHSDSSQSWRADPPSVASFGTTTQLLVHPGLWGDTDASFRARVHEGVDEMRRRTETYARERYVEQTEG